MSNFDQAYKLFNVCALQLVYEGATYRPTWDTRAGEAPRHDAHVATTWLLAQRIVELYGYLESGVLADTRIALGKVAA